MNWFPAVLAAALCVVSSLSARASPGRCIADWSVAAGIVAAEKLATVEDVTRRIRAETDGHVVKTLLCEARGAYVYRLTVKASSGALENRTIDARRGR